MWIAGSTIGLRRILVLFVIGTLLCSFLGPFPVLFYCSVGLLVGSLITIAYIVYNYGIFVRLYSWTDHGYSHEVRQYVNFINPKENYRGICKKGNVNPYGWDSRIYTTPRKEWAYFDIIRQLLNANRRRFPQRTLLLGGGGGSIPYCISDLYPIPQIEAIEISKQMICVAKRYFCRTSNHQKIKWIHQDAFTHIKQSANTHRTYDCIIVDLFENGSLPKFIFHASYIRSLHSILESGGLLFMNFGWKNVDIKRLKSLYAKTFNNYKLYLYNYPYNRNIIGVNWSIPPDAHLLSLN